MLDEWQNVVPRRCFILPPQSDRLPLIREAFRLEWLTIGWMTVEAVVAIGAGITAGSLVLVAFGVDSVIELASASVLMWRLSVELRHGQKSSERAELIASRIGGALLFALPAINDAGYPDIVHWHGLYLPSVQDGAMEEGSPMIAPGQSLVYSLTPKPAGTRWYHSHATAGTDLTRSTYSGEFGFLIVEPAAGDPGRYDREVLLAARLREGEWVSMQDLHKGPPPDNGLEVLYHAASLGDRISDTASRIRVKSALKQTGPRSLRDLRRQP